MDRRILWAVVILLVLLVTSQVPPVWQKIELLKNRLEGYDCPRVDPFKLANLQELSKYNQFEKIIWGDSVVEELIDIRYWPSLGFVPIGQSRQTLACALEEMSYVVSFHPRVVVVHLGGNDADGKSWYGPREASVYYEGIIQNFLAANITPVIHLVNPASPPRNQKYVSELNKYLIEIAKEYNLTVITPLPEFKYTQSRLEIRKQEPNWTYDGEHPTIKGYLLWIENIQGSINQSSE